MGNKLELLKEQLAAYGRDIESTRVKFEVASLQSIDDKVSKNAGVYWIETNMPVEEMKVAISEVIEREKKLRAKPPKETRLIKQNGCEMYVVYSGTEFDLNRRIKQHLFNEGSKDTVKLGCRINELPFSKYKWVVSFKEIDNYEIRYAIEAWWRLNIGWPVFCLR